MEVKFLKDYRGKETKEFFYKAGEIAAVKDHHAARLFELGFAEEYVAPGAAHETALPEIAQADASVVEVEVDEAPQPAKPKKKAKK